MKTEDTVVIDFVGSIDGVEFEGGKRCEPQFRTWFRSIIPGFEEQLVGTSAGEEIDCESDSQKTTKLQILQEKKQYLQLKLMKLKQKKFQNLDDELAKDIDEEVETLDELKAKFRKELEDAKAEAYNDAVETAAIETAVANVKIKEIPEEMIHEEVHRAMNESLEACNNKVSHQKCTSKSQVH